MDVAVPLLPSIITAQAKKGCDFSALLWLTSVFHLFFYPEPAPLSLVRYRSNCGRREICRIVFFSLPLHLLSERPQRKFDILNIWGDDIPLFAKSFVEFYAQYNFPSSAPPSSSSTSLSSHVAGSVGSNNHRSSMSLQ